MSAASLKLMVLPRPVNSKLPSVMYLVPLGMLSVGASFTGLIAMAMAALSLPVPPPSMPVLPPSSTVRLRVSSPL